MIDQPGRSLFKFFKDIVKVLNIINPAVIRSIKFEGSDKEDFFFEINEYIKDIKRHIRAGKTAEGNRKIPKKNIFWKLIKLKLIFFMLFNCKFTFIYILGSLFFNEIYFFERINFIA